MAARHFQSKPGGSKENLSNVPDHLAERLKVLYSKCERHYDSCGSVHVRLKWLCTPSHTFRSFNDSTSDDSCCRLKHAKPAGSPEQIESDENLEDLS